MGTYRICNSHDSFLCWNCNTDLKEIQPNIRNLILNVKIGAISVNYLQDVNGNINFMIVEDQLCLFRNHLHNLQYHSELGNQYKFNANTGTRYILKGDIMYSYPCKEVNLKINDKTSFCFNKFPVIYKGEEKWLERGSQILSSTATRLPCSKGIFRRKYLIQFSNLSYKLLCEPPNHENCNIPIENNKYQSGIKIRDSLKFSSIFSKEYLEKHENNRSLHDFSSETFYKNLSADERLEEQYNLYNSTELSKNNPKLWFYSVLDN